MDNEILDQQALNNIRALQRPGTPSILEKIVQLYLAESPQNLAQLEAAAQQHDAPTLAKVAHRIKSSSANLGATQLTAWLRDLEMQSRSGQLENAATLVQQIRAELPRVEAALRQALTIL